MWNKIDTRCIIWRFSSTLQMGEENYILTLRFRLHKLIILKKWKPIDIHTNSYEKNVGKKYINVWFILNPYIVASYCTSYLSKVDKKLHINYKPYLKNVKQTKKKS